MAKIKVTLPEGSAPVQGKQVSFTAPCDSLDAEAIQIGGLEYAVCDAMGNTVAGRDGVWRIGALVSVVLDCNEQKAYVQNGNPRVETISGDIDQIGDIKITTRTNFDDTWLLCNGDIVNATTYPKLYDLMESKFEDKMASGWNGSGLSAASGYTYYGTYYINGYYIISWHNGSYYGISYSDDPNSDLSTWKTARTGTYGLIDSDEDIKYVNGYYVICNSQYINFSTDLSSWTTKQIHTNGTYNSGDIFYKDGMYYFIVDRAEGSSTIYYYLEVYTATELNGTWTVATTIFNSSYYSGTGYGGKPRVSRTVYDEETGYYWFAGNANLLNSTSNYPVIRYSTDLLTWNTMELQSASWGRLGTFDYRSKANGYHIIRMLNTSSNGGLYYSTSLFANDWVKSGANTNSMVVYFGGKYHSIYDSNYSSTVGTYWATSEDLAFDGVTYTNINASRYTSSVPMKQRVMVKAGVLIILTVNTSSASFYPHFLYSRDPETDGWADVQISSWRVGSGDYKLRLLPVSPHLIICARLYTPGSGATLGTTTYPIMLCNSTRLPKITITDADVYIKAKEAGV